MNYTDEELASLGVVKDRRRRFVLLIPETNSGYQITDKNLKILQLYKSRYLLISMVFVFLYTYGSFSPALLIGVSFLAYLVITLVYKYFYLKQFNVIKVREEDESKLNTLAVKKSIKNDYLIELFVSVAVLYILVSPFLMTTDREVTQIDLYVIYIALAVIGGYTIYTFMKFVRAYTAFKKMKDSK